MDGKNGPSSNDEIDMKTIILTIQKGWFIILISVVVFVGLMFGISKAQTPVYSATSTVFFDLEPAESTIDPENLLLDETICQLVAQKLGVSNAELQTLIQQTTFESDENILNIIVEDVNPQTAVTIANTWADVGISEVINSYLLNDQQLLEAKANQIQSEKDLIDYLTKNHLLSWTWADLSALTGLGSQSLSINTDKQLPSISAQQRLEIAELMQNQINAMNDYIFFSEKFANNKYLAQINTPVVIRYAEVSNKPVRPNLSKNIALGAMAGILFGVFLVFIIEWWKDNFSHKAKNPK